MDNAFQELDYSDISAKNLNKKERSNDFNTKTRGGIIRLGSLLIIFIICLILFISIISKSNSFSTKENYLQKLKEEVSSNNEEVEQVRKKNTYLEHQILEAEKSVKIYERQKTDKETNIENLGKSTKKLNKDIEKIKKDIQSMEEKLKEIQNKKNNIDELQKSIDYYTKEIEKLRKEKNEQ